MTDAQSVGECAHVNIAIFVYGHVVHTVTVIRKYRLRISRERIVTIEHIVRTEPIITVTVAINELHIGRTLGMSDHSAFGIETKHSVALHRTPYYAIITLTHRRYRSAETTVLHGKTEGFKLRLLCRNDHKALRLTTDPQVMMVVLGYAYDLCLVQIYLQRLESDTLQPFAPGLDAGKSITTCTDVYSAFTVNETFVQQQLMIAKFRHVDAGIRKRTVPVCQYTALTDKIYLSVTLYEIHNNAFRGNQLARCRIFFQILHRHHLANAALPQIALAVFHHAYPITVFIRYRKTGHRQKFLLFMIGNHQSVTGRTHKQTSVAQLHYTVHTGLLVCARRIMYKTVSSRIIAVKTFHRTHPQTAFAIVEQGGGRVETKRSLVVKIVEIGCKEIAVEPVQSKLRCYPHLSTTVLKDILNHTARQLVGYRRKKIPGLT